MKIELRSYDESLLDRVGEKTNEDYLMEAKDGYLDIEILWRALSDLEDKYLDLQDKYDEYKEFVKDNYKQKTLEESYR